MLFLRTFCKYFFPGSLTSSFLPPTSTLNMTYDPYLDNDAWFFLFYWLQWSQWWTLVCPGHLPLLLGQTQSRWMMFVLFFSSTHLNVFTFISLKPSGQRWKDTIFFGGGHVFKKESMRLDFSERKETQRCYNTQNRLYSFSGRSHAVCFSKAA